MASLTVRSVASLTGKQGTKPVGPRRLVGHLSRGAGIDRMTSGFDSQSGYLWDLYC